jgi:hypothetical protein
VRRQRTAADRRDPSRTARAQVMGIKGRHTRLVHSAARADGERGEAPRAEIEEMADLGRVRRRERAHRSRPTAGGPTHASKALQGRI